MSSGGDNPDDSKGKSKAVPTGRVQRFAKVAKLAGGMLAEGTCPWRIRNSSRNRQLK